MILLHICDIFRNQAVGTNGRKQFSKIASTVPSTFVPMTAQAAIQYNFSVGFAWDIYFSDGIDVQIGDKLIYNSQAYIVRGKQPFLGFPGVSHIHVMAETEHANGQ